MSCCTVPWSTPSPPRRRPRGGPLPFRPRAAAAAAAAGEPAFPRDLPRLLLHHSLDAAGISTSYARVAREGFEKQVGRLTGVDAGTSIAISRGADLARAALHVAEEDDSLVSHSSVPLPVDAFLSRLDDLAAGFCATGYLPPSRSPPEVFLDHLDRYFYEHKGFRRTNETSDARAIYLHTVLTCRSGSALMLSLIYSEMLKTLRIYGLLDFDVEIYFPHDLNSLPRGYDKHKSKLSDEPHIMTSKSLLVKMLETLKDTFWPFQSNRSASLFLNSVAANHYGPDIVGDNHTTSHGNVSALEIAAAKAAQHRLMRGVWTNVSFGDMRRALAACERLILLRCDVRELRDYAALLYHCGYYKDCLQFLTLYQTAMIGRSANNPLEVLEEDAVNTLLARVNLILAEDGWNNSRRATVSWSKNSEPW